MIGYATWLIPKTDRERLPGIGLKEMYIYHIIPQLSLGVKYYPFTITLNYLTLPLGFCYSYLLKRRTIWMLLSLSNSAGPTVLMK